MKLNIITILVLLTGINRLQAQTCCPFVAPIEIIFIENNAVKIIVNTSTPTLGNKINFSHSINQNQINISGCFTGTIFDQPSIYEDTLIYTNLAPGVYNVNYKAYYVDYYAVSGLNCAPTDSQMVTSSFNIGFASIQESVKNTSITTFPNPASDMQNLSIPEGSDISELSIAIFDINGTFIKSVYTGASVKTVSSYIGDLNAGVYVYRIITGTDVRYSKFIKN